MQEQYFDVLGLMTIRTYLFVICIIAINTKYDINGAKKNPLKCSMSIKIRAGKLRIFPYYRTAWCVSYRFRSRNLFRTTILKTIFRLTKEILNYKQTVQVQKPVSQLVRRILRHLGYACNLLYRFSEVVDVLSQRLLT